MQSETLFIKKLKKLLPAYGSEVVVGVGDDAAVLQSRSDKYLLVTTDVQVEGVHFKREWLTAQQLGQRAATAALSDIAAMGGKAKHILVSLVVSSPSKGDSGQVFRPRAQDRGARMTFIKKLYKGFGAACKKYGVDIIGGNISRGPVLIIDIFVLGEIDKKHLVLRSGARAGDAVLVTGKLGRKAVVPAARLKEGQILAKSGLVTSMIDISDGLSTDLLHICDASGVGVRIFEDKLPRSLSPRHSGKSSLTRRLQNRFWTSQNDTEGILNGGEDYELCLTVAQNNADKIIAELSRKTGTKVTIIGEILKKSEGRWIVNSDGKEKILKAGGWDHFS